MAAYSDFTGGVWDWVIDRGSVLPYSFYYQEGGATVTDITSARIDFFTGDFASPTASFSNAVTITVTAGTTMTFTLSEANTRAFAVGTAYSYKIEITRTSGTTKPILKGNIKIGTEYSA